MENRGTEYGQDDPYHGDERVEIIPLEPSKAIKGDPTNQPDKKNHKTEAEFHIHLRINLVLELIIHEGPSNGCVFC